jgi:hypothetical protein
MRIIRRAGPAGRYRYVFVVTYGRSGSTLLTGLLNTIPGYRIRGENLNALYRLYQAVTAISEARGAHAKNDSRSPRSPWYGTLVWRPDDFRRDLVDAFVVNVLCPRPGDRVLGFKEVRYTEAHVPDLGPYLDFLLTAFPHAKIVFNHRAPEAVARSAWWADRPGALERIVAADGRLSAIPADGQRFHFHFDRIDDSLDHIRELFEFLGEELDEPRVRRTLATPHSYSVGAPAVTTISRRLFNAVARRR